MTALPLESNSLFTPVSAFEAEEQRLRQIVAEKARRRFDDEYFHSTPRFLVDHTDEQKAASKARRKAEKKEVIARSCDADECLVNGCAIWELNGPRSILGQELKQLHRKKLAAEAEANRAAEEVRKANEKREKRRLSQKASRQRKADAKKLAAVAEA